MGDEVVRRRRITSGRYQVLMMLGDFLPRLPFRVAFLVISHKFLRPFLPFLMIAALILNVPLILFPDWWGGQTPVLRLALAVLLAAQVAFYLAAGVGAVASRLGIKNRLLNVAYYIVSTNFGGMQGLLWFLSGRRTVLWEQVKRE
jgi:hypothetical protein